MVENVTDYIQNVVVTAERSYTFVHLDHLDGIRTTHCFIFVKIYHLWTIILLFNLEMNKELLLIVSMYKEIRIIKCLTNI